MVNIRRGDFIRIKKDSNFRPGQDGMVMSPPDSDGNLGMMFHYDRFNEPVGRACEGIENWNVSELDLTSLDR